jgi:UDP-N-acetylmuramyl pentapeptide phosphotransferase/UDP-N-acetylglucosamine-1-phosphate transferase
MEMTTFLLSIMVLTALLSAAASIGIVLSQCWHGNLTLDHDIDGVQKVHQTAVPRVGGLAIVSAIVIGVFSLPLFAPEAFSDSHLVSAKLLLVAAVPAFFAGIVEDLTKKVSVRIRLIASMLSALAAGWLLGAVIEDLNIWGVDMVLAWTPVALVVTAVTVAGGVNAINIIDGFNGLAGGTVVVMLGALGVVGWMNDDMLITELSLLGAGATLGFLCVNYPKGKLFLGDGGAYFLGFWVAEIAVLLLVRNPAVSAWQVLSICAYPVIEVLYSMYRRKIVRKVSPGSPDALHMHTLVYRRVIRRRPSDAQRPWQRNAGVVRVILPWIIVAACVAASHGASTMAGIAIVSVQAVLYVAIYARLVRGKWRLRQRNYGLEKKNLLQQEIS